MIATILSIRLGDLGDGIRVNANRSFCVLSNPESVAFNGDIKFTGDDWDMPGVWYTFRRNDSGGFILQCNTMRRHSQSDPNMRLKPDVYDRMIKTLNEVLSNWLESQLNDFIAQYEIMRATYVDIVSGVNKPGTLQGQRILRAELKRLNIDPVVYTDHLDFSHVVNVPIII